MKIFTDLSSRNNVEIYPVVEDSYSYLLSQLALHNKRLMFIANDDANANNTFKCKTTVFFAIRQ